MERFVWVWMWRPSLPSPRCGTSSVNISAPRTFSICVTWTLYPGWTTGTPTSLMECSGECRWKYHQHFVIWKFRSGYLESNFSDVSWHMSLTKSCKPSGINNLLRSSDKLASYNLPKVLRHSKNEILKISRNYQTKNYNKYLFQPLGDPTVLKFQSRDLDGYLTVSTYIGCFFFFTGSPPKSSKCKQVNLG